MGIFGHFVVLGVFSSFCKSIMVILRFFFGGGRGGGYLGHFRGFKFILLILEDLGAFWSF